MESMGARVVLKLVFAHGPLTRWTLTGQGIDVFAQGVYYAAL